MAGYKELRENWNFDEASTGSTGTRVFIDETGGTASLPSLGDSFDILYGLFIYIILR